MGKKIKKRTKRMFDKKKRTAKGPLRWTFAKGGPTRGGERCETQKNTPPHTPKKTTPPKTQTPHPPTKPPQHKKNPHPQTNPPHPPKNPNPIKMQGGGKKSVKKKKGD